MTRKEIAKIRKAVKLKVASGALRQALLSNTRLQTAEVDAVVRHGVHCRHMRTLAAYKRGELHNTLKRAGWPEMEIDFLLQRARSRVFDLEVAAQ